MKRLMNHRILTAALAAVGFAAFSAAAANAQVVGYSYGQPAPPVAAYAPAPIPVPLLTAEQIDQLTGPIALYPDPLLAQLLPAATYPNDIAAAAAWLQANPQPTEDGINAQPWDPSVKAIVHYPPVFQQLAGNMEWTQALGAAFLNQPQDVMDSIQRLRAQAQAVGSLYNTPEQQVVNDNGCLEILPANPQFCYVPVYDPTVIYLRRGDLRFSRFNVGLWLNFGFDWGHHWISGGYDWVHYRPGHAIVHAPDITMHPWVHDVRRAAPVMPQKYVRPAVQQDYRGYKQPAATPEQHNQVFNTNQSREEIDRATERAKESHVVAPPAHVEAPPHVDVRNEAPHVDVHSAPPVVHNEAPHVDMHSAPPVVHNEPPHVSNPAPAPIPVFRPSANPADINQQSQRGNQSMHR